MTMRSFDAMFPELVKSFCSEIGYDFYPAYSGRGMFGATCPGIVHGESLFALGVQLTGYILETLSDHESGEVVQEMLRVAGQAQEDGMGLRHILYFPSM